MAAPVRPGFGETLPALLRDRFGVAPRTTIAVAAALALALAAGGVAVWLLTRDAQYVHRGDPVFNLVYDDGRLHRADPRPGEYVRLEAERRRVRLAVSVRPLALPPYTGDVGKGVLPLLAERRLEELRERHPDLVLREEARATVNEAPGYQLAYVTGPRGNRTLWQEIFVVPDEERPRGGVVLLLENHREGRLRGAARATVKAAKSAFRSFKFGTERR